MKIPQKTILYSSGKVTSLYQRDFILNSADFGIAGRSYWFLSKCIFIVFSFSSQSQASFLRC